MWSCAQAGSEPRRYGARQQQVISTACVHDPGTRAGGGASAPENVAAHRSLNGAAGVLRDQQTPHALRHGEPLICFQPNRYTEGDKGSVDSDASLGGQDNPFRPDRTVIAHLAEKYVGRVLSTQHSTC